MKGDRTPSGVRLADVKPADLKKLKQEVLQRFPTHKIEQVFRLSEGARIQSLVDWIAAAPAGSVRRYEVNVVRFPFDLALSYDGQLPRYTIRLDVQLGADAGARSLVGSAVASDGIATNLLLRVAPADSSRMELAWWRADGSDFHFADPLDSITNGRVTTAISVEPAGTIPYMFIVTFVRRVTLP